MARNADEVDPAGGRPESGLYRCAAAFGDELRSCTAAERAMQEAWEAAQPTSPEVSPPPTEAPPEDTGHSG